jgi:hypothetical protein
LTTAAPVTADRRPTADQGDRTSPRSTSESQRRWSDRPNSPNNTPRADDKTGTITPPQSSWNEQNEHAEPPNGDGRSPQERARRRQKRPAVWPTCGGSADLCRPLSRPGESD